MRCCASPLPGDYHDNMSGSAAGEQQDENNPVSLAGNENLLITAGVPQKSPQVVPPVPRGYNPTQNP